METTKDSPTWSPLLNKLGEELATYFNFMKCYESNGTKIYTYKHRQTRRYLNLDSSGQCYSYKKTYLPTPDEEALNHVYS